MQIVSRFRPFAFALLLFLCSSVQAQNVDLCAVDQNPSQFCGQLITIRGTTWHGVNNGGLKNDKCQTVVWWRTPENAGVHVRFKLKRDQSWRTFTHYDAMSSELGGGPTPSPDPEHAPQPTQQPNYRVTATFHGLFACKRQQIPWYFLVLESVSDVKVDPD